MEERIEELENRIKELEEKNNANITIINTITYTMRLMFEAVQNNANLIGQLTTVIENIEKIIG